MNARLQRVFPFICFLVDGSVAGHTFQSLPNTKFSFHLPKYNTARAKSHFALRLCCYVVTHLNTISFSLCHITVTSSPYTKSERPDALWDVRGLACVLQLQKTLTIDSRLASRSHSNSPTIAVSTACGPAWPCTSHFHEEPCVVTR